MDSYHNCETQCHLWRTTLRCKVRWRQPSPRLHLERVEEPQETNGIQTLVQLDEIWNQHMQNQLIAAAVAEIRNI